MSYSPNSTEFITIIMIVCFCILVCKFIAPGNFNVSAIVLFKTDGTPLVRALVKVMDTIQMYTLSKAVLIMHSLQLSQLICSYQELNITLVITDRSAKTVVTRDGPIFHRGNDSFEYDITSSNLKREQEYLMTVTVNTTFESSTNSYLFSKLTLLYTH